MVDVSVSQLVNQVDNSHFTLYTEWENTCFKIILLRPLTLPLYGEMHIENANYFLNHLDESFESYLQEAKRAFSGENADIQFFLQDDTFTWKQQNIVTRGEIALYPLSNVLILSNMLKRLSELYQTCQERISILEKENQHLNNMNTKLKANVEDIINRKNTMEKDLYMKFLLLLNTKKEKIRELQEALDNKEIMKTVYDETTDDESETSDRENEKTRDKVRKRNINVSDDEDTSDERNFKKRANFLFDKDKSLSPVPSTSKGKLTSRDATYREVKSKQDFEEEESEEDLFAE